MKKSKIFRLIFSVAGFFFLVWYLDRYIFHEPWVVKFLGIPQELILRASLLCSLSIVLIFNFLIWLFGKSPSPRAEGKAGERERQYDEVNTLLKINLDPKAYWKDQLTFIGWTPNKKPLYISNEMRTLHMELIGPTGSGKSELILPLIFQDLKNGSSVFVLDGKGEKGFYERIKSVAEQEGREENFYYLNPSFPGLCNAYNPLKGKNPDQLTDLVVAGFEFGERAGGGSEYYSNIAKTYLNLLFKALYLSGKTFTFRNVLKIAEGESIAGYRNEASAQSWEAWAKFKNRFRGGNQNEYLDIILKLQRISEFDFLNSEKPDFTMDKIAQGGVLITQINCGEFPKLGPYIGKIILFDLMLSVAKRQANEELRDKFLSVVCDEFSNFVFGDFANFQAMARSAYVGVHLSFQSLGSLGLIRCPDPRAMAQKLRDNSRITIGFQASDPETADDFSKRCGTKLIVDTTYRKDYDFTGGTIPSGSERVVDEFIFHPNLFKEMPLSIAIFISPWGKSLVKLPLYKI